MLTPLLTPDADADAAGIFGVHYSMFLVQCFFAAKKYRTRNTERRTPKT
jgi:hypothetical protein